MLYLSGSAAVYLGVGDILGRKPRDLDFLIDEEDSAGLPTVTEGRRRFVIAGNLSPDIYLVSLRLLHAFGLKATTNLEVEVITKENREAFKPVTDLAVPINIAGTSVKVSRIPCRGVLMLKDSHKYLKNSPHFLKTMLDIHALRKRLGLGQTSAIKPLQDLMLDYEHPSLAVSKDAFFDAKEVPYKYDHDTIHEAVAYGAAPLYLYYQGKRVPGAVMSDQKMFCAMDYDHQLMAVAEEAYVLALERCLIPGDFTVSPEKAFRTALEKICTSITSGWFREFAWENYFHVMLVYSSSYVDKFKKGLENGTVMPYNGSPKAGMVS